MESNVLLKNYTTMRLGGPATSLATAKDRDELVFLINEAQSHNQAILVMGEGSNLIVGDKGFDGLIILNRIPGFEILNEDTASATLRIGAGEKWDDVVAKSVEHGLSGIENLSAIPGYAGAAPVQNIGAYGQEIADTLIELEAYDLLEKTFVTLKNADCDFAYRQSIFNTSSKRRYIVTSITLQLSKTGLQPPFYTSLQKYLDDNQITDYSPAMLRLAVTAIRSIKLPNPKQIANAGSFFKNPIVEKWLADDIKNSYNNAPIFTMDANSFKISAGWLIEETGLKGYQQDGMKVYDKNALVLINESATSYTQLSAIRDYVVDAVRDKFRINLTQEPEEIGV